MTLSSGHGSSVELETPNLQDWCVLFLDLIKDLELERWNQSQQPVPGVCGTTYREADIGSPFPMSRPHP